MERNYWIIFERKTRMNNSIWNDIEKIREGYSQGHYNNSKYGITKTIFNNGYSFKIFGEQLSGKDFISFNYYITKDRDLIKPCEMPEQKVVHFLKNVITESTLK
ncbi:MAG: hypothetical protein ACI815_001429 [Psychroserpens sp.]